MLTPGIHDEVPAGVYHADDVADTPTLSSSVARMLCDLSPLHAWSAHPRLNPAHQREDAERFDLGTVAHAVLLEGQAAVETVDAADWRTKAARERRDEIRAAGKTPLLADQWDAVVDMVEAVRRQLAGHEADPPLLDAGAPERTLLWEEDGGVMCRARLDWLRDDRLAVDDVKTTTGKSAHPETWSRTIYQMGYDVQAAFYLRGLERLEAAQPQFRFVACETAPPYAVSVLTLGADALELARRKVAYAVALWGRCLLADDWPGYRPAVASVELPAWEEARWLARETEDAET